MGGFFRRLRRSKEVAEPAETEEAPEEPTEGSPEDTGEAASDEPLPEGTAPESDIYPPADGGMPLPEAPDPGFPESPPEAPLPPDGAPDVASAPRVDPAPAPDVAAPSAPPPSAIDEAPPPEVAPPPLPEADPTAARSSLSRQRPGTLCFLCGSEMDGSYCPSCKMHWTE